MSPRRKTITIAAAAAVFSMLAGLVGGARVALAWSDNRTETIANRVVEPIRNDLKGHLDEVEKAMKPGGGMHDFKAADASWKVEATKRDILLVEAVYALCKANPRAACPEPSRFLETIAQRP